MQSQEVKDGDGSEEEDGRNGVRKKLKRGTKMEEV